VGGRVALRRVPIAQSMAWGFNQLSHHMGMLLPFSTLFFAPELCGKLGYDWPVLLTEVYKTALFFVLLLRAMKLIKPEQAMPPKGSPGSFARGEMLKVLGQGLGFLLGIAMLAAWIMLREPATLASLLLGGSSWAGMTLRAALLKQWWLGQPWWAEALALLMVGWLPLRVHVMYNFYGYIVADRGLDAIPALRESARLGRGLQTQLLAFYALCLALNLLAFKLYVIGAIFTFPATVLATVYVYRSLSEGDGHGQ
jgi:hypothetical protein